jgi:hypothetical protein
MITTKQLKEEIESLYRLPVKAHWGTWLEVAQIEKFSRHISPQEKRKLLACAALTRTKQEVTPYQIYRLLLKAEADERVLYPGIRRVSKVIPQERYTVSELQSFFCDLTGWIPSISWIKKSLRELDLTFDRYGAYKSDVAMRLISHAIQKKQNQKNNGRKYARNLKNAL